MRKEQNTKEAQIVPQAAPGLLDEFFVECSQMQKKLYGFEGMNSIPTMLVMAIPSWWLLPRIEKLEADLLAAGGGK